jgi:hypothetical protein
MSSLVFSPILPIHYEFLGVAWQIPSSRFIGRKHGIVTRQGGACAIGNTLYLPQAPPTITSWLSSKQTFGFSFTLSEASWYPC